MMFDSGCNNIPLMEEIANNFAEYGYKVSDVELVDLFANTRHCESICVLKKD